MKKELYMKVLGAIDVYVYSLPQKGPKALLARNDHKASALIKMYLQLAVAVLEEEDLADSLINLFIAGTVASELLRRINKLNEMKTSYRELEAEVRDLNKASNQFRASIRSVYFKSPPSPPRPVSGSSFFVSPPGGSGGAQGQYDFPLHSLFFEALPANISINITSLRVVKEIKESAHTVIIYENEATEQLYFGKTITSHNQLEEYATEVTYSAIWRYFLGERVSASYIMLNASGTVKGICSEGLRGFVEYAKMPEAEDRSSGVPGLVSIILFAYIFMEDDLHVKNLGLATVRGETVFGKIDHDYICSRWEEHDPMNQLERKFPLALIQRVVQSKQIYTVKDLLPIFRFSPGTQNNPFLRLAHHLRPRDATTVGPQGAKNFGLYQLPNAQEEFIATLNLIKQTNYDEFEYRIKRVISELARVGFSGARAMSLTASINSRLRRLAAIIT